MCLAAGVAAVQCYLGTAAVATVWTSTAIQGQVHEEPVGFHSSTKEERDADRSVPSPLDVRAQGTLYNAVVLSPERQKFQTLGRRWEATCSPLPLFTQQLAALLHSPMTSCTE